MFDVPIESGKARATEHGACIKTEHIKSIYNKVGIKGYMEQLKNYAWKYFIKAVKHDSEDYVEYHVKPVSILDREVKENDLTFKTREQAREYKRVLKNSHSNMKAKIIRREYIGGKIASETEVSWRWVNHFSMKSRV